tara:strand:- start:596 stop:823 length:228 start_codon:yes stop_codon:yes gene_type:complete
MKNSIEKDLKQYFYSWKEVIVLTTSSETTIRRAIKKGLFPSPYKIFGGTKVGFWCSDIEVWAKGEWTPKKGGSKC